MCNCLSSGLPTDPPAPRRRRRNARKTKRKYGTNLLPQSHYAVLCPICNACPPVPPAKPSSEDQFQRVVCGSCATPLTVKVPAQGKRLRLLRPCPESSCLPGTRPGLLLPAVSASQALPREVPVRRLKYLETEFLRHPPDKELDTLKGVRLLPLCEQLGMAIKLGLPVDEAVLSVLAVEGHWLFAHHPRLGVVEQVIAMLVSVALPHRARERPPRWVYSRLSQNSSNPVLFPELRTYCAWARMRPWGSDVSAGTAGYADVLRRQARSVWALRPWVLKNLRVIRATDWVFSAHGLLGEQVKSPAWAVWQTCCGNVRLDTSDAWLRNREAYYALVWMD